MRSKKVATYNSSYMLEFTKHMNSILRTDGLVHYKDFDLMNIYSLAPYIVIFDVEPDRRFKYRFMGTQLVDTYGFDGTGKYLDQMDLGVNRNNLISSLHQVIEQKKPQHISTNIPVSKGYHLKDSDYNITYERLAYPLVDADDKVIKIISLHSYKDYVTSQTKLFEIHKIAS